MLRYFAVVVFAGAAWAQQWELGADIGYGIYHDEMCIRDSSMEFAGVAIRCGIAVAPRVNGAVKWNLSLIHI